MFKTAARILLLRVLPRRLIPIVTVVEALLFLRSVRKRSRRPGDDVVRVNDPSASRTAPPTAATAEAVQPATTLPDGSRVPARRAPRIGRPTLGRR